MGTQHSRLFRGLRPKKLHETSLERVPKGLWRCDVRQTVLSQKGHTQHSEGSPTHRTSYCPDFQQGRVQSKSALSGMPCCDPKVMDQHLLRFHLPPHC